MIIMFTKALCTLRYGIWQATMGISPRTMLCCELVGQCSCSSDSSLVIPVGVPQAIDKPSKTTTE